MTCKGKSACDILVSMTSLNDNLPGRWRLQDAKARFSELVRRAHDEGPQAVTVRGRRAVVVMDAEEFERMAKPKPELPLVEFLESLHMEGLDLARERAVRGVATVHGGSKAARRPIESELPPI